jgi:hypothetical protein
LVGWEAARVIASTGLFSRLPSGAEPPPEVFDLLGPHIPRGGTFAVSKSNHPGRWVALLIAEKGKVEAVAKVATNATMREALAHEAHALHNLAPLLPAPLSGPKVLSEDEGLILLEPVEWRANLRPWGLPQEVARALGVFFRRGVEDEDEPKGLGHGDFAPWNLFRTPEGWTILDWEHAGEKTKPFVDILHYVTMAHSLLGHPSRKAVLEGIASQGWIGDALAAYAEGAQLSLERLPDIFVDYLKGRVLSGNTKADKQAARARDALLAAMGEQK